MAHVGNRQPQAVGRLLIREAVPLPQSHHLLLHFRKPGHRPTHPLPYFAGEHRLFGRLHGRSRRLATGFLVLAIHAPLLPLHVPAHATRDLKKPGKQGLHVAHLRPFPQETQERLLNRILRPIGRTQQHAGVTQERRLVRIQDLIQGDTVPLQVPLDQRWVRHVDSLRGSRG